MWLRSGVQFVTLIGAFPVTFMNNRSNLQYRNSQTVRLKRETKAAIDYLAQESGESVQEIVAKAIEAYRRQRIADMTNAAYAALRADPLVWQQELDERAEWDATLADSLEGV